HSETNLANTDYRENRSMILSGLSLWEKGSPLHKSTQQVRTQGLIRRGPRRIRQSAHNCRMRRERLIRLPNCASVTIKNPLAL
ncbi:hypothetical protein, partial [Escherichia coli]|uniref:hypothetical protein n=1 Tax=Escherichia coli TaxID=562 RepID=UPI001BC8A1AC